MAGRLMQPMETRGLRHILNAAFALTFAIPALIFVYNAVRFSLLEETVVMVSFAAILVFSLIGFILLRRTVDRIISLAVEARVAVHEGGSEPANGRNELKTIAETFQKLVSRLEESTGELGRRVTELASLKELTDICAKAPDFRLISESVIETLMVTTDAESGVMFSVLNEGKTLAIETLRGIDRSRISQWTTEKNATAFGNALGETGVLTGRNFSRETGFNPSIDGTFSGPFIVKAISARGKTIGVLGLFRGDAGKTFSEPECDYVATALGQIAFAFDNTELIRELRQSCDELKAAQGKIIELERVAAIREVIVTISDRINNPLTVIRGHAELIRRKNPGLDASITASLNAILESCASCTTVMRKLHAIEKPISVEYAGGDTRMIHVEPSDIPADGDISPLT